jgi:hypothetical protein
MLAHHMQTATAAVAAVAVGAAAAGTRSAADDEARSRRHRLGGAVVAAAVLDRGSEAAVPEAQTCAWPSVTQLLALVAAACSPYSAGCCSPPMSLSRATATRRSCSAQSAHNLAVGVLKRLFERCALTAELRLSHALHEATE